VLDHALAWAGRGFRVFPLHPGTKRPVWKGWPEHATSDPARIEEIWSERDYNIGVCTDDLIVIDVDVKNGKQGMMSLLDLELPLDTLTVKTPTGGLHLYYQGPSVANSAGKLGEGLDVRSFHGYVIAPGSQTVDGAYRLAVDGGVLPIPGHVLAKLPRPTDRFTNGLDVELDDPAAVEHARQWLERHEPAVEGRGGDDHTYRTALKLRDFGVSEAVALDLLLGWNEGCLPPWLPDALAAKVANAYAYGKSPPGSASPQHLFAGVDVPEPLPPDEDALLQGAFWHGESWQGSVEWLYRDLLPTQGVCILNGQSNAGKTFVALDFAESLALGRPFFGVTPQARGGTIMLVGEAYGSVKMRLAALGSAQKPLPLVTRYVGGLAARGAWKELTDRVNALMKEMRRRHDLPVRLVILDTLSSSGILVKEDDNAEAATALKAFSELSAAMNALIMVIHHPPKSGEGERGASAIRNNADYVMTIKREGTSAVREIEMTKSRDGETRAFGTFTLIPKEIGVDSQGVAVRTMIVSPGEPKIREARAGSTHAALAVESVEWALMGAGVQVEGDTWAEDEDAKKVFYDRWTGVKNHGRIAAAFTLAVKYCLDIGSLEALRYDDRLYLKPKRIDL